ncbi:MAG: DUF2309 domain-containing protein [Prosthecobacter sp.]|uniref:DUF2309 domain-containing protein n=1 Tax=Prosthecobacter sp. TaxID=1965333 RepID=UPI0019E947D1|nr:DUF2309 domain-containing protein [Prosthecobacter sp.]MBE2281880.1 DUF2309 domain-containing protein [Prosthecobacter sp.]
MSSHSPSPSAKGSREHLQDVLDHAAHYLPTQGPIGVFVHHNTLHAFQHQPFEPSVIEAANLFKAEPFLSEESYQNDRARGRILDEDIDDVLSREPDAEIIPGKLTRRQLRRALLVPGVRRVNGIDVAWSLEEGNWLESFRHDLPPSAAHLLIGDRPKDLWDVCLARVPQHETPPPSHPKRPREALLAAKGIDLDLIVHPPLIRLVGAYLDQGIAYWPMPLREQGLLAASRTIMGQAGSISRKHLTLVGREFRRQVERKMTPDDIVLEALERLAVFPSQWEEFVTAELIAMPGWAGMVRMLENDVTLAPHDRVRCSLMEYLALRLTYTLAALEDIMGDTTGWHSIPVTPPKMDRLTPVARFFDAAQLTGLSSNTLAALPDELFQRLVHELAACNEVERRRLLHLAYERRHERSILIPLSKHRALPDPLPETDRLVAQVVFCIDEREESFRRALEEADPSIETVGAAGFFGVAIDYAGIDDAGGVSLCPVVVKPGHSVREVVVDHHAHLHEKRQWLRRAWAAVARNGFISSRTLVRGWISTACLGFLSLFPLIFRVLSPREYGRIIKRLNRAFLPEPKTEVTFMRDDPESRDATTGLMKGFTEQEMADRVYSVLGFAGLHKAHARLVVILGHGSTSLNNPYESAYCCGACGGRTGAPNARIFAIMANRPGVRAVLKTKGVVIPEDTWFLGGYHDTCSDDVEYFDVDLMPETHHGDLNRVKQSIDQARIHNADERVRRFGTAGPGVRGERALRCVQARSEHIAEPRPEYGHCTNAVAYVGRRDHTRGLFMDRRAFLVSYDATKDPANEALARVLGAVIPVCGGINLEYYFSTVDNEVWGAGTKLPHNITGLVGVMNGFQGDLRTGLPVQTVEIHEPVRILFVVETTPPRLMSVIKANKELVEFVCNRWIRLATMDPDDGHIEIYRGDDVFEPLTGDEEPLPVAPSSMAWYRGKMEHLPLARIEPKLGKAA